jgi:hypothetical protein
MSDEEWGLVQEALVKGGLRECVDNLLTSRPFLSEKNRRIIEQAYDDGNGNSIDLVPISPHPWFAGMYDGDCEVMLGLEHRGVLYSIVHASGGGICSVIVGDGLINNEMGVAFQNVGAAKAYVEGMTAK